jgi:membrane-bound serine protease (ClpP class)
MYFFWSSSIPDNYAVPFNYWLYLIIGVIIFALIITYILIRQKNKPNLVGNRELIGKIGEARTNLDYEGQVFVRGELWKAIASEPIAKGEKVEVISEEGLVLKVKKYQE